MDHHCDDSGQGVVRDRQVLGIGLHGGEATVGVPQHSGGQVDAERDPTQFTDPGGMDGGAAA